VDEEVGPAGGDGLTHRHDRRLDLGHIVGLPEARRQTEPQGTQTSLQ
jgi:hypothetical protein